MSNHFRNNASDTHVEADNLDIQVPDVGRLFTPLPSWLTNRFHTEEITYVRGPRFNPSWERYVTHPAFFLVGLILSVVFFYVGRQIAGSWKELPLGFGLAGICSVFGSVLVLAFFNGYFTRLVVTSKRVVILQGYEQCRSWGVNQLPSFLVREERNAEDSVSKTIDLQAVDTLLGSSEGHFADSKTIRQFRDQIEGYKKRGEE